MALGCSLSQNITRANNCNYVLNEINEIYLTDFENATGITVTSDSTCSGQSVSAIATGVTWYKIEVAKGSASFTDELVVEDTGGKYRTHTVTFNTIGAYNSCLNKALDDLSLGKYIAIVKTANGNIMLGRTLGLEATTATLAGGNDQNGMQIVLAGNAIEAALPVVGEFSVAS